MSNQTCRLRTDMGALERLPTEAAAEFRDWHFDPARRAVTTLQTARSDMTTDRNRANGERGGTVDVAEPLSEPELRMLRVVIDHPGTPSGSLSKLAGIGTHQAIALRKSLVDRGFLKEHRLNRSSRGRGAIVLEPLPSAMDAVGH